MGEDLTFLERQSFIVIGRRFYRTAAFLDLSSVEETVEKGYYMVQVEGCDRAKCIRRDVKLGDLIRVLEVTAYKDQVCHCNKIGVMSARYWEMSKVDAARKERNSLLGFQTSLPKKSKKERRKGCSQSRESDSLCWIQELRRTCAPDAVAFVDWLMKNPVFDLSSKDTMVLNIAGGKGDTSLLLSAYGINSAIVDPRQSNISRRQRKLLRRNKEYGNASFTTLNSIFTVESAKSDRDIALLVERCTCIIGLHPDQATDHIVNVAVEKAIPFAIVPCCVFAREFPNRLLPCEKEEGTIFKPVQTRIELIQYLTLKHRTIQKATLTFEGANTVLYSTFENQPIVSEIVAT